MVKIITTNEVQLQVILNVLICSVSEARCKDNSHSRKVSWPLRCLFLVCT